MKRREFLTRLGGAVAASQALWPGAAHAQQSPMPTIGFLHSGSPEPNARRLAGFRKGLRDAGLVEGKDVMIEFRWAQGDDAKLAEMAADLIARKVAVIATLSSTVAAVAAKAATSTIPIFFLIADPPVELGLVASLSRPGGNATGITTLAAEVAVKRFALLRELVPQATHMAVLVKPSHPSTKSVVANLQAAARTLGTQLDVLEASTDREIEQAYVSIKPGSALVVGTDPLFFARRVQLAALSIQHKVPTICDTRDHAEAGALSSYGPNTAVLWQQAGGYVARIVKGEKPANLPVVQAATFETVFNVKTAKALGLEIPSKLLFTADEVIE